MLIQRSGGVFVAPTGTLAGRRLAPASARRETTRASCDDPQKVYSDVDSGESLGYLTMSQLSQTIGAGRRFGSDREHA